MNKSITQAALTALDAVLLLLEPDYTEWCSDGNDPTDHLWYKVAHVHAELTNLDWWAQA